MAITIIPMPCGKEVSGTSREYVERRAREHARTCAHCKAVK